MRGGVTFTQGDGAIFLGLAIDCDAEWHTEFVCARISLAYRRAYIKTLENNPPGPKTPPTARNPVLLKSYGRYSCCFGVRILYMLSEQ